MRINLFDIDQKTGKAKITKHVQEIWYLNTIVEEFGEDNALKLFKIFDMVYNLNPEENVFANLPDDTKYETILRSTYPELETLVDMNSDLIEQALDLVGELYETEKYRAHRAIKKAYNRIIKELEYTGISLDKESGNMGEIKKALDTFEDLNKKLSSSYKELEEEMSTSTRRGGRKSTDRRIDGKEEELE